MRNQFLQYLVNNYHNDIEITINKSSINV